MAGDTEETTTPKYTMGYGDSTERLVRRRTAAAQAAYLLPHLKPGMRVLDVGCGPGSISVGLAGAVDPGELHGVDIEKSQVELAAAAAREAGYSSARFQVADALHLPFPNHHFDAVHCHAVLMHVPDTTAVLAEINRVLKPGGVLGARDMIAGSCFIEPDLGGLSGVYAMFAAVLTTNGGHPQMGKELRGRFSAAGFVDVEATGSFEPWGPPSGAEGPTGYHTFSSLLLGPPTAGPAIAYGIATPDEFDQWREALALWNDDPGAWGSFAFGEAIGRKP